MKYLAVDANSPEWNREFDSREKCINWIMDGLENTEGAERDHWIGMLLELWHGHNIIHYN